MLHTENLTLEYKDGADTVRAVSDVFLTIEPNRFIGILGPSGSGKSSLLYLLSGLRRASGGDVYFNNRSYRGMNSREMSNLRRTEFGFVFQHHFLINYLTVLENIMVAAPVRNKVFLEQAEEILNGLGMSDKRNCFVTELSGGERQRVAIGRAIIHKPRVIFADEPTGLLDSNTGHRVMELLRSCSKGGSLIAVTHNPGILENADTVITLRDGKIIEMTGRTCLQKMEGVQ